MQNWDAVWVVKFLKVKWSAGILRTSRFLETKLLPYKIFFGKAYHVPEPSVSSLVEIPNYEHSEHTSEVVQGKTGTQASGQPGVLGSEQESSRKTLYSQGLWN